MPVDANGLQILPRERCLELLSRRLPHVGRVALMSEGALAILPVNYRVVDGTVVFRTGPGTKLAAAASGVDVALEVDDVDEAWEDGWSVVVRGAAIEVTDPVELERLRRLPLRPWAGGDKSRYIRIVPSEVSGRGIS